MGDQPLDNSFDHSLGPDGAWVHEHMLPDMPYAECITVAHYIRRYIRIKKQQDEKAKEAERQKGMFI